MTYSPFASPGSYPSGPVSSYPWRGIAYEYPNGCEDFSGYSPAVGGPDLVECSGNSLREHLDVTSGCLDCVLIGSQSQYTRGQVRCDAGEDFRVVALAYEPSVSPRPVKWTDCANRFRFHGHQTGDTNYPGVKAFIRYRTEDDLYVASWRYDGVVQIQRKWSGVYTTLAIAEEFGAPTPDEWHWMEFDALGSRLRLFLDDELVLQVSSGTFSWGTAGIRIDGANGMYLDEWSISQPGVE